jgi:hypothetical protein
MRLGRIGWVAAMMTAVVGLPLPAAAAGGITVPPATLTLSAQGSPFAVRGSRFRGSPARDRTGVPALVVVVMVAVMVAIGVGFALLLRRRRGDGGGIV